MTTSPVPKRIRLPIGCNDQKMTLHNQYRIIMCYPPTKTNMASQKIHHFQQQIHVTSSTCRIGHSLVFGGVSFLSFFSTCTFRFRIGFYRFPKKIKGFLHHCHLSFPEKRYGHFEGSFTHSLGFPLVWGTALASGHLWWRQCGGTKSASGDDRVER